MESQVSHGNFLSFDRIEVEEGEPFTSMVGKWHREQNVEMRGGEWVPVEPGRWTGFFEFRSKFNNILRGTMVLSGKPKAKVTLRHSEGEGYVEFVGDDLE